MRTRTTLLLAAVLFTMPLASFAGDVSPDEAAEIAVESYIYAYPLVLMDTSRQVMTNAGEGAPTEGFAAPVNQFKHLREFPDATFTDVVRPNADTLYSTLWFDVSKEPLVVDVPDSGGRYYLLPMLDFWTDVFASPGKRTTGTGAQTFAITGLGWKGDLPKGVRGIAAPTAQGWLIGRTQTNGKADYDAVHKFQDGLKAVPLSKWGQPYTPPAGKFDPKQDMSAPVEQVEKMSAAAFFARFVELTKMNPPHENDHPVLDRMARIGLVPGQAFNPTPDLKAALEKAVPVAQQRIKGYFVNAGRMANGWSMLSSPVGTYATDYLKRALVADMGLGANVVEDAIYPTARGDSEGRPFDSGRKYVIRFTKEQIPPVRAFWSLTMYNDRQFFAANPISRYAIGDRDNLKIDADGSLTLYIQRDSPGADRESNWLPAPKEGGLSMNLRLYWPKLSALDGTWAPAPVKRIDSNP